MKSGVKWTLGVTAAAVAVAAVTTVNLPNASLRKSSNHNPEIIAAAQSARQPTGEKPVAAKKDSVAPPALVVPGGMLLDSKLTKKPYSSKYVSLAADQIPFWAPPASLSPAPTPDTRASQTGSKASDSAETIAAKTVVPQSPVEQALEDAYTKRNGREERRHSDPLPPAAVGALGNVIRYAFLSVFLTLTIVAPVGLISVLLWGTRKGKPWSSALRLITGIRGILLSLGWLATLVALFVGKQQVSLNGIWEALVGAGRGKDVGGVTWWVIGIVAAGLVLLFKTLASVMTGPGVGEVLRTDVSPAGTINLELAWSAERAGEILRSWGAEGREAARRSLILDFGFIAVYVSLLILLVALATHAWADPLPIMPRESIPYALRAGSRLILLVVLAGILDVLENIALLLLLKLDEHREEKKFTTRDLPQNGRILRDRLLRWQNQVVKDQMSHLAGYSAPPTRLATPYSRLWERLVGFDVQEPDAAANLLKRRRQDWERLLGGEAAATPGVIPCANLWAWHELPIPLAKRTKKQEGGNAVGFARKAVVAVINEERRVLAKEKERLAGKADGVGPDSVSTQSMRDARVAIERRYEGAIRRAVPPYLPRVAAVCACLKFLICTIAALYILSGAVIAAGRVRENNLAEQWKKIVERRASQRNQVPAQSGRTAGAATRTSEVSKKVSNAKPTPSSANK